MKMSLKKSLESFYEDIKKDPEFLAEDLILRITEKISRIMKNKNITKSELAERLNTSKAYITKLLNGNPNMTVMTLAKLSAVLEEEIINVSLVEDYQEMTFDCSELSEVFVTSYAEQGTVHAVHENSFSSYNYNNLLYNREASC